MLTEGAIVRIRPLSWFKRNCRYGLGDYTLEGESEVFTDGMVYLCGQDCTLVRYPDKSSASTKLFVRDDFDHYWHIEEWMIEPDSYAVELIKIHLCTWKDKYPTFSFRYLVNRETGANWIQVEGDEEVFVEEEQILWNNYISCCTEELRITYGINKTNNEWFIRSEVRR